MKRVLSLLLTFALMLTLFPGEAFAFSEAYGSEVWLEDTALHNGVTLSDNIYWSHYYEQLRHEYFVTLEPNSIVRPVTAYGASVCDRLTVSAAAESYEALGWRVVAGINGDFYDTAFGYPLGVTISDGELLSGGRNYYAVGFSADGSVIMGEPTLSIRAEREDMTHELAALNMPRVDGAGVTMMTAAFRNDHTTGTTTPGVTALCSTVEGIAAVGGQMTVVVDEVIEGSEPVVIGEHQIALTVANDGYTVDQHFVRTLTAGQTVKISFTAADGWERVAESVGAMYLLVKDGVAQEGFPTGYAPRSAVGVKETGEVIFYTVDGRQEQHSMGASLKILAQRMAELGCVTAVCLDGGGSTMLTASKPDSLTADVVNSPSDKIERKVSNHILLLAPGSATGIPDHIYLTTNVHAILPGHTVELTANVVDTAYFPMDLPVELSCSAGEIIDGVFTAPQEGGLVTITASHGELTTETKILVVDTPDEMVVHWDGEVLNAVTMVPGDTAKLTVSASYNHIPLETDCVDYVWELDPTLGSIDKNGILTTNYTEGNGNLTISKGNLSVSIALTLDGQSPFADTTGHWGVGYLSALYHKGILTGVQKDDALYAYPDNGVTRMEFAVLLARYLNLNLADYADIETPFTDMDQVDAWAADAVRAMYALGIVGGITLKDGTQIFDPRATLSRAQAVTMLGRSRQEEGIAADLSVFTDAQDVPEYAWEHFETMVALGVIGGSYGKLNANRAMTRAEICKVLAVMP